MCNSRDMEKYGKFYRPDPSVGKSEYSSSIKAESLEGLPPAYIETAEFDCLRDGGINIYKFSVGSFHLIILINGGVYKIKSI